MRRHMQNISFVTIIGVLLSCAFFFSQQVNHNDASKVEEEISQPKVESLEDLRDCTNGLTEAEQLACYQDAVNLTQRLVEAKVKEILALETDTGKRITFVETQTSWEESRDADCAFVSGLSSEADQQEINKLICLRDHNLERLLLLDETVCQYYDSSTCGETNTAP